MGEVCARRTEAETILRGLSGGKSAVAELVQHDDPRSLRPTLALGDIQEMLGRVPQVQTMRELHPNNWVSIILSDGQPPRT